LLREESRRKNSEEHRIRMNRNPWDTNQTFETQLFGRALNEASGIDALAPHDDAVIYTKRVRVYLVFVKCKVQKKNIFLTFSAA